MRSPAFASNRSFDGHVIHPFGPACTICTHRSNRSCQPARMVDFASPRAARLRQPSWLDARILGGVLVVLISVVLGARLLAAADKTIAVWSAAHELSAGTTLQPTDVQVARVHLQHGASRYLSANHSPIGYVINREVGGGELLPASALAAQPTAMVRQVTVPVAAAHLPPDLARGDRVDVYATAKHGDRVPRLVASGVLVADAPHHSHGVFSSNPMDSVGVVLSVGPDQVSALVAAAETSQVDLVRVPRASA